MTRKRAPGEAIKSFILNNVTEHPSSIVSVTAEQFQVSRQTVSRYVTALMNEGQLKSVGNTRGRKYELVTLVSHSDQIAVTPELEEHIIWRESIVPYLSDVKDNVLEICEYGFTEMVNNVVSHSSARDLTVWVERDPVSISLTVLDNGIGIFKKLQQAFGYDDPRHALLELSKGKLTSNTDGHTGEGIFFTSRMFSNFSIWSGNLFYVRLNKDDDWLIEVEDRQRRDGTLVEMRIDTDSTLTARAVFDQHASGENFDFSKTHVSILLAKYEKESLLSRSQARRVLARFDRFKEVLLDFRGVEFIGQAFADEIFRVFHQEHAEIDIIPLNASPAINEMISRVNGRVDLGII